MEEFVTPEIKICGIKTEREAEFLNEAKVDYAGFVFYGKSKRNISLTQANKVFNHLDKRIKKVAVTVSPDISLAKGIAQAGFDVLQVHGEFLPEILTIGIPVWRAVNITDKERLLHEFLQESDMADSIAGYVADGAGYGGGKTFDWEGMSGEVKKLTSGRLLILAGGLNAENVRNGIRYFLPDVVDVSSGVEEGNGKSREKILEFVKQVRDFNNN